LFFFFLFTILPVIPTKAGIQGVGTLSLHLACRGSNLLPVTIVWILRRRFASRRMTAFFFALYAFLCALCGEMVFLIPDL